MKLFTTKKSAIVAKNIAARFEEILGDMHLYVAQTYKATTISEVNALEKKIRASYKVANFYNKLINEFTGKYNPMTTIVDKGENCRSIRLNDILFDLQRDFNAIERHLI